MRVRWSYTVTVLVLSFGLLALVLAVLPALAAPFVLHNSPHDTATTQPARERAADLYVAPTGTDSGDCTVSTSPCRTVQYAVDQASEGSVIKVVSGTYTDIHQRASITQVVYISRSVTIRGGYSTANWTTPNPDAHLTVLNPQGQGRVMVVTGTITVTVEGLYITGGDAAGQQAPGYGHGAYCGGGIYVNRARFAMSGTTVIDNTTPHYGGGLWVGDGDSLLLTHNEIISNTVIGDAMLGGGVYAYHTDDVIITHNTLLGNRGLGDNAGGAAAGLEHCPGAAISHNEISHNHASGAYGGLIMGWCDGAILSDNSILDNTAGDHGGGVGVWASRDIAIRNSLIIANYAGIDGGGVSIHDHSRVVLDNNIIADNQLTDGDHGAGVYVAHSQCDGRHNTIARNSAVGGSGDGSGVFVSGDAEAPGTAALTNTILLGHTVGIYVAGDSTARLEGTLWGSGAWANGTDWNGDGSIITGMVNVWGDPAFVEPDSRDYHIEIDSAAFDAGVDAGITVDIDGDPRPAGGGYDIGADEYPAGIEYRHTIDPIAKGGPCTSVYTITNQGDTVAYMMHQFYDRSDDEIHTLFDAVATSTSKVYDLADIDELPDGYAGHVVITADQPFIYTLAACPVLTRTCWARLTDDPTDYPTIQAAVDAAYENGLVKIAGHCRGVGMRGGVSQTVFISLPLTLRGGYTTTNWAIPNPNANPTTLDAQGQGRVLYILSALNPVLENLHIVNGDATGLGGMPFGADAGGGVYIVSTTATLSNVRVFSNTADYGGGLFLRDSGSTISNSEVASNSANYDGGGIYLYSSDATLSGDILEANTAAGDGGGLYLRASETTVINSIIADNQASSLGSGLYVEGSPADLLHTTIAKNSGGDGSGVHVTDWDGVYSTMALTNTIIASHAVGIYIASGNTTTLEGTLWGSGAWANGIDMMGPVISKINISGDPAFVDPDNGEYHIGTGSAAQNAGVDAGVAEDIDGDPRTDGRPDIGADELVAALTITKQADPDPVEAGARLTYTIRVANTSYVTLTATVTDVLPAHVTPSGILTWTPTITAPGGIWTETVVVTVAEGYGGSLTNLVEVTTKEGARGIYTETVTVATESTVYLPFITRTKPATTATGEYLLVGTPCTTVPCLPGMVYAVLVDDRRYYPTVDNSWLWWNRPWDGYAPEIGDFVTVSGYAEEMIDTFGISFYNIEVASLGLTYRPPTTTRAIVISDVLSYGDEYVEICNDGTQSIQLDGWTLNNSRNRTFTFPDYLMQPGEICRIYTNQEHPEWCGFTYVSESDVWDSAQDCAYLRDSEGVLIDAYCYCYSHTAHMTISATDTTVEVGKLVTVTTTLFDLGCTGLGLPLYRLYVESEEPEPIFNPSHPEPIYHELGIGRGQSDTAEFVLEAVRPGQATLRATASFEVHLGYPGPAYWGYSVTAPLIVTVTQ